MNQVIDTIQKHRSIRRFEDKALSEKATKTLLECAIRAPTTAMGHFYSVIEIKDLKLRQRLYEVCGKQASVLRGSFFVFTVDLHRSQQWAEQLGVKCTLEGYTALVFGTIDMTVAAQNMVLASESLGLGTVYIGMVGHRAFEVSELLGLPSDVIPVLGLVVGHPAEDPALRPRIPVRFVHHVDRYREMSSEDIDEAIAAVGNFSSGVAPANRDRAAQQAWIESLLTGKWWISGEESLRKALESRFHWSEAGSCEACSQ
jgi:FMN reductase (NADPH)